MPDKLTLKQKFFRRSKIVLFSLYFLLFGINIVIKLSADEKNIKLFNDYSPLLLDSVIFCIGLHILFFRKYWVENAVKDLQPVFDKYSFLKYFKIRVNVQYNKIMILIFGIGCILWGVLRIIEILLKCK